MLTSFSTLAIQPDVNMLSFVFNLIVLRKLVVHGFKEFEPSSQPMVWYCTTLWFKLGHDQLHDIVFVSVFPTFQQDFAQGEHHRLWTQFPAQVKQFFLSRCLPIFKNINGLLVFVLCTFRLGPGGQRNFCFTNFGRSKPWWFFWS